MGPRIALVGGSGLTFDVDVELPDVDAELRRALRERGADVAEVDWKDAGVRYGTFDVAVVRTTWDYTADLSGFTRWAERTAAETRLINPPETLRWSADKQYLLDLEAGGLRTVPTVITGREGVRAAAERISLTEGCAQVVLKPTVGVGADRVVVTTAASAAADSEGLGGRIVVQPYRDGIHDGELSVVLLGGGFSHAVRKRPAEGEFRVQSIYGGTYTPEEPADAGMALAEAAVRLIPGEPDICRVDLIPHDGGYEISEVEAIEPDLYLPTCLTAADRLADIIVRRAQERREERD